MNSPTVTFNPSITHSEYLWRLFCFFIAFLTAFTMSAYFVVGYFAGHIKFWNWTEDQAIHAIPGIGICIVLTGVQVFLYSQTKKKSANWKQAIKNHAGTVLAILVCACFAALTEIGQGMHRDEVRMTTKSLESPTLKALVGNIQNAANNTSNPYGRDLQLAQRRLATCRKKLAAGIYKDCAESEANVAAVKENITLSNAAATTRTTLMINTAKSFERDEDNYHPVANLIRQQFGVTGLKASFILSLLLIAFFEYGFHYLGRRYAEKRDELLFNGYDVRFFSRYFGWMIKLKKLEPTVQNASEHPQNTVQNTSPPITVKSSTDACSDTLKNTSEHPGTAQDTLDAIMADPDQFAILHKYVIKPVFSLAFLDIATGKIRCTQNGIKDAHNIGGEFTAWIMLLLEVCDIVTAPQGKGPNKIRTLVKPLTKEEGIAALSVILPVIIGLEEATKILSGLQANTDENPSDNTAAPAEKDNAFPLIYTEIKQQVLNSDIKPTVRPVTDAVTTIIQQKSRQSGNQSAALEKPARQQIAQQVLEKLESEGIIIRNKEGGVGKPKYILATTPATGLREEYLDWVSPHHPAAPQS